MTPQGPLVIGTVIVLGVVAYALLEIFLFRRKHVPKGRRFQETLTHLRRPVTACRAFEESVRVLESVTRAQWKPTFLSAGRHIQSDGTSSHWDVFLENRGGSRLAEVTIEPYGDSPDAPLRCRVVIRKADAMGGALAPLPLDFKDSPIALAELSAQGLSLEGHDLTPVLAATTDEAGRAIWCAQCDESRYATPFAQAA